jgi:hypothetical protein
MSTATATSLRFAYGDIVMVSPGILSNKDGKLMYVRGNYNEFSSNISVSDTPHGSVQYLVSADEVALSRRGNGYRLLFGGEPQFEDYLDEIRTRVGLDQFTNVPNAVGVFCLTSPEEALEQLMLGRADGFDQWNPNAGLAGYTFPHLSKEDRHTLREKSRQFVHTLLTA